jgi:hypothetical protein
MKKALITSSCIILMTAGCKKRSTDHISETVTVSYPVVAISGQQFYSIPVGGMIPAIAATAYDSILKESYTPSYDASVINNTKPGLYVVPIIAKNKNGYTGNTPVYVAVTNIDTSVDISGNYLRNAAPVIITKIANGLYSVNDVGGAPTLQVRAYFAQLDSIKLQLPLQPTSVGDLYATDATVSKNAGGATVISWKVINGSFGSSLRTFVKQ